MSENSRISDFRNTDFLKVAVKREKLRELEQRYACFGWTETECVDDKLYDNITELTFCRPHKIPEKDRLQLLQVDMEMAMNEFSKTERNKHSVSTAISLTIGTFAAVFIIGGILLILLLSSVWSISSGILMMLIGALSIALLIPHIIKMRKREEERFEKILLESERVIERCCADASALTGIKYAKEIDRH